MFLVARPSRRAICKYVLLDGHLGRRLRVNDATQVRWNQPSRPTSPGEKLASALSEGLKSDPEGTVRKVTEVLNPAQQTVLLSSLLSSRETPHLRHIEDVAPPPPRELVDVKPPDIGSAPEVVDSPGWKSLLMVAVTRGLPFVAFGFFDNIIMITAGEEIDVAFGAKLGLSSMAAAGLGNTIADVAGISISNAIENAFKKVRWVQAVAVSKAQMNLKPVKTAKWLGAAVGMMVGCLLGLTPLLFIEGRPRAHTEENSSSTLEAVVEGM